MIEHEPAIGEKYDASAEKYWIIGESHYLEDVAHNGPTLTKDVLKLYRSGEHWQPFFASIEFAFDEGPTVWDHSLFFNYIPRPITAEASETTVSKGQVRGLRPTHPINLEARRRFDKLLQTYTPTKIFVFSHLAWKNLPESEEDRSGEPYKLIDGTGATPAARSRFEWCTLADTGQRIRKYGLQHPRPYDQETVHALKAAINIVKAGKESDIPAWQA
jgi:hypothetical protein